MFPKFMRRSMPLFAKNERLSNFCLVFLFPREGKTKAKSILVFVWHWSLSELILELCCLSLSTVLEMMIKMLLLQIRTSRY